MRGTGVGVALEELGWNEVFARHFELYERGGLVPARVGVQHRNRYGCYTAKGEIECALAGKLRARATSRRELPAVGDWVAVVPPPAHGLGTVRAVLPRLTAFTRKAAGRGHEEQIVAANIDVVFIVTSLNAELNQRRIERYLTLAWESGARPVIVLSKADRCDDPAGFQSKVEEAAPGVPVRVTSCKTRQGIEALRLGLAGHKTGALLGSSGVGKSTLVNALVGYERQATAELRESGEKGRHKTARRELVFVPGGGLLIDTPGMRELQLTDAGRGLLSAFEDVESLGEECAFSDCRHESEPGCAVRQAVWEGRLSVERLESFQKLVKELEQRRKR